MNRPIDPSVRRVGAALGRTALSLGLCLSFAAALSVTACAAGDAADATDAAPGAGDAADSGSGGGAGGGSGFQPVGGAATPPGGNQRPVLDRIGDREAEVGVPLEIQLTGSDPDGDAVSFNVRSSLPEGAKFEKETGRFSWTPLPAQQDTLVLLTFEVADPAKLRDQETIQISVVGAGMGSGGAPRLDPIGDVAPVAGRPYTLQLEATDPNGDPLTYTMRGAEALVGATLDAQSGLFAWTPDVGLAGQTFPLTFVVSDGALEAKEDVNVVVRSGDPSTEQDLPPRITPIEDREIPVGQTFDLVVQATDEHPERLTYELVTPVPAGASFDAAHAHFVFTPTADQANIAFRLVFRVSDGTYRAIENVTLTVVDAGGGGGGGGGACTPDPGEPNLDERTPLTPGTPASGSICLAGDVDTYTLELAAGDAFAIDVRFAHADGDIDIGLFGPAGSNFEQISDSSDDDEALVGSAPVAGTYDLVVAGYQDAVNPAYTVSAEVTAGGGGGDCGPDNDPAEGAAGNDDLARAASLREHLGTELRICPGDTDFFYVELTAGQRVTLDVRFSHAEGDLDSELSGPAGYRVASGSADDDEQHLLDPVPETGRYVLEVFGYNGAANAYTLALTEVAGAPCMPDRVEPNDTRENAEPFAPELYRDLTYCGEPDWYKTQTAAGEALQVYISYDAPTPPDMAAFTANGAVIADTTFEVVAGDGCQGGRAACRRFTARPPAAGWVHYQVRNGTRGMPYDLTVRVVPGAAAGMCSVGNQTCSEFEICDYGASTCEASYCDDGAFRCPSDYLCHENWCVELCNDDLTCARAGFTCKVLDGLETCGLAGQGAVGDGCFDFTDCAGSLDCLIDAGVPGGYCSRTCRADADCAGGACADFGGGNFCGKRCTGNADCRAGYVCSRLNAAAGGTVQVCEPAP
ncbi:putative Ig domain-containing protein [Myxococcota bacterium]|nr:putative Ig domain-containing protein [Myxococcota bacterium]